MAAAESPQGRGPEGDSGTWRTIATILATFVVASMAIGLPLLVQLNRRPTVDEVTALIEHQGPYLEDRAFITGKLGDIDTRLRKLDAAVARLETTVVRIDSRVQEATR